VQRFSGCHDEPSGGKDYIQVCDKEWEDKLSLAGEEFELAGDLSNARLDTAFRGKRLFVEWRATEACSPGGDEVKMGMRSAFPTGRWGDDLASPDAESVNNIGRRVEPDSANHDGDC
jgi:hypothetical protein